MGMSFNDSYHLNMTDKSKYFGKSLTFSIGDLFYLIFFPKTLFSLADQYFYRENMRVTIATTVLCSGLLRKKNMIFGLFQVVVAGAHFAINHSKGCY